MVMSIPDPAGCGKTIVACQTLDVLCVWDKETITRRMLKKARHLTRPPTGTPRRALSPGEGLQFAKPLFREWPRLPFTARIEGAQFHRARSASKKGTWPLPSHPLRPRVA